MQKFNRAKAINVLRCIKMYKMYNAKYQLQESTTNEPCTHNTKPDT